MNGFGFAQWARSVRPELKILLAATPERTVRNAAEVRAVWRGQRGVFAKRVAIWIFGSGCVKGSPIPGLRRQRRSGARLRGKQGRQSHLIPCGSSMAIH